MPIQLSIEVKQPKRLSSPKRLYHHHSLPEGTTNSIPMSETQMNARNVNYSNQPHKIVESMVWRPITEQQATPSPRHKDNGPKRYHKYNKTNDPNTTTITSTSIATRNSLRSSIVNISSDDLSEPKKTKRKKYAIQAFLPKQKLNPKYENNMNRYRAEYQFVKDQMRQMEERMRYLNEDSFGEDGDAIAFSEGVLEEYKIVDDSEEPTVPPLPSVSSPSQIGLRRAQSASSINRPKSVLQAKSPTRVRPQQRFDPAVHSSEIFHGDSSSFGSMTRSVTISRPKYLFARTKRTTSQKTTNEVPSPTHSDSGRHSVSGEFLRKSLPQYPNQSLKSSLRQSHTTSTKSILRSCKDFDTIVEQRRPVSQGSNRTR
ncbi:hypothetical protein C9374_012590 [Naegleria lovaniensis]|uniref:Uncharacterized protein n=1 Tax=Naegleria lovaniensis TaxID=51637 RepID=A0AA88H029_NAELO|nr:uncharacterized protein C9374_012590 [Naegleria lovaniensis]KAG2392338.1 hypothetical protein C9374_012590 [Naegleria lovaniensis]